MRWKSARSQVNDGYAHPTVELRAKLEVALSVLRIHVEVLEPSLELDDELSDEDGASTRFLGTRLAPCACDP